MHCRFINDITTLPALEWNRLIEDNNPFLKHEFLSALETHDCVGLKVGWEPCHAVVYDDDGTLLGAMPLYIKHHSYGEFVFDWAWADAYQQNGLEYYPKLLSAIPFTPLTGKRLLTAPGQDCHAIQSLIVESTIALAHKHSFSSIHWLFPEKDDRDFLANTGLAMRLGCQYHWHNRNYLSFDDYLSHFSSRKRKNVMKERKQVASAGITFKTLHGHEISEEQWQRFHHYYCAIYERKWGFPSLSLGFFEEIGRTLSDQVIMVLAYQDGDCIATALNLKSDDTLYGRHWGCREQLAALHFECCYYQGLEYCIEHGLARFEPGAQGEHKIARGFLPAPTWSAHWIAHPEFSGAVARYVSLEMQEIEAQIKHQEAHSPFKQDQRP